ncbi:hypothetical protein D3C80_740440 [compost metagenome]
MRNMPRAERKHGGWPNLGFTAYRQIRLPVIKEIIDSRLQIKRRILMDNLIAQLIGNEFRRCHCSGCHNNVDTSGCNAFDQRRNGNRFPNACSMSPYNRTLWARYRGFPVALTAPDAFFLATRCTIGNVSANEGIGCRAEHTIGRQHVSCPTFTHLPTSNAA